MLQQKGTEGPRAPLFRSAVLILFAAGGTAAQTVDIEELRRCSALETSEQQLACFERLASADRPAGSPGEHPPVRADRDPAADAPVPGGPPVQAAPAPEVEKPPAPDETGPGQEPIRALAPGLEVDPYPGPVPGIEAAAAPAPAVETEAAPVPDAEPAIAAELAAEPGDEFGRRYIDGPEGNGEPEVVTATINEVSEGRHRILYFHFANGQLWRQMEPGYFAYPKDGSFEVEIRQGMMGDYQMRVGGKGRMTRIVRVR